MSTDPYVLSIAGFDPCGGAGILADIKTFEAHKVKGLGVCTSITYQNDVDFKGVDWFAFENLTKQLDALTERFDIRYVKIGLIQSYEILEQLLVYLREKLPEKPFILWDPILKASAGFKFHEPLEEKQLYRLLQYIDLITPNAEEIKKMVPHVEPLEAAQLLSATHCTVLLKGGHLNAIDQSNDYLYQDGKETVIEGKRLNAGKRGTGCVLSSSLLAHMALGAPLQEATVKAKQYTVNYLNSTSSALGFHHA